jgi:hypothetical protein
MKKLTDRISYLKDMKEQVKYMTIIENIDGAENDSMHVSDCMVSYRKGDTIVLYKVVDNKFVLCNFLTGSLTSEEYTINDSLLFLISNKHILSETHSECPIENLLK